MYDSWYYTSKGAWISRREMKLLLDLLQPEPGRSLLDVGAGTGHFTRRFADSGLRAVGLEPDLQMLDFARRKHEDIHFVRGDATALPFPPGSFDFVAAVTSLCFVSKPENALHQMWRVARRGIVVGLLNRNSMLYRRKAGSGGYAGARWDRASSVRSWGHLLDPQPRFMQWGTTVFFPGGSIPARILDHLLPKRLPWGSFLAFCWHR